MEKYVSGIICLHVDDLFCVGDPEFYQHVITSVMTDYHIGIQDINVVLCVGRRVCWETEGSKSFIQVDK